MKTRKAVHHIPRPRKGAKAADSLLGWYDAHRRDLPWRARPGESADPYRVWVSEIMLQQTTVTAVAGYFARFIRRYPDIRALASAPLDDVLKLWAGLGYYARARNLHRGARAVMEIHGGALPRNPAELTKISGIGRYTANAIAAIAFGEKVAAIDTNAERVLARLLAFERALPAARPRLSAMAADLVPSTRPGDFAQALMDLGSAICLPEQPRCGDCPIAQFCKARRLGLTQVLPVKKQKSPRRLTRAVAFVAIDAAGSVYLVRRPEDGLFGGMMQPPLTAMRKSFPALREALRDAPFSGVWKLRPGKVRHMLTHLELEVRTYVANFTARPNGEGIWLTPDEFGAAALPTAMRKILKHALAA
jgi:A/G-specific adenine glycosylase